MDDIELKDLDATKITEDITAKKSEFNDLFIRMDDDFKLWSLASPLIDTGFRRTTKEVKVSHETDINIVSNDLRTFSDKVQATLSAADMQIFVRMAETEGEDKRDDIGKLERLFYFALEQGDIRLRRLLLPPLREALIWYSLVRGWVAGRFLVYKDGEKNVIFDNLPMDPRWLTYEVGGDGFAWTGYETSRSAASLKNEYDYKAKKEKDNIVIDFWKYRERHKIVNGVICDNTFIKPAESYDLLSIPILIMPVATRPPVKGTTGSETKGYGESVFAPCREINETRNKFASVVATHAKLLARQPVINLYDSEGVQLKSTIYLSEAVLNLPMGHNKLEPTPMKEISPTVISIMNWLSEQMERGTMPNIPVGAPPPSGTLYNMVQEAGNRVFNPQVKNLSYFYADALRLIEEQLISGKIRVDVKQEEKRKYFETKVTPVDLKKPHIIKVEFTARTPWTQLDTYQVADMAKRLGLPDAFIHEYILKLPDPKGLGDLSAIEMAEHSPKLAMVRAIDALLKIGRKEEAEQVMRDLYAMEMRDQAAAAPPPPPEAEEEGIEEPPVVERPPVEGTP